MRKEILFLMLTIFFLSCNTRKQGDIDKALKISMDEEIDEEIRLNYTRELELLNSDESDSAKLKNYFKIANRYWNLKKMEDYKNSSIKALQLSIHIKNQYFTGESYYYLGDYYLEKKVFDSAYFFYHKSGLAFSTINNSHEKAKVFLQKARLLYEKGSYYEAERYSLLALAIFKEKKKNVDVYKAYNILGLIYDNLEMLDEALKCHGRASELLDLEEYDETLLLEEITQFNIGLILQKTGDYNNSISCFEKLLTKEKVKEYNLEFYAHILDALSVSRMRLSQVESYNLLLESMKINDSLKIYSRSVMNRIHLSEFFLRKSDTSEALMIAEEALRISNEVESPLDKLSSLKQLCEFSIANNKYAKMYVKSYDSLQLAERKIRDKFARIEYETDEILQEKNTVKKENSYIIAGSLFTTLLLTTLLIIKNQHVKQRRLQLAQQQQQSNEEIYQLMLDQQQKVRQVRETEKHRVSKDLHDGIMNRLTSTRLNLFTLQTKQDAITIQKCLPYIKGIQEIEKEIRLISHDLQESVFSGKNNFSTMLEELIEQQRINPQTSYRLKIDPDIEWDALTAVQKLNGYRILQEALQNARLYAKAANIFLRVKHGKKSIKIELTDDGIGFDAKKRYSGIGLKNMLSRADDISAKIKINSEINQGTQIILYIPL